MGKTLSIIIGAAITFLGLILLMAWRYEFLFVVRGFIPVALILGGLIALFAGLNELKDTLKSKK